MRSFTPKACISFLILITWGTFNLQGEGTKQLKPDTNYICDLQVWNGPVPYSCFAVAACGPDQKLYVRVGSPGEKVYIGFGFPAGNLTFRIKNLAGMVVFGPFTINSASLKGYIKYYRQAIAGPDVLDPAGYKALVFDPGIPGDYDIEFNPFIIPRFDITVIDTTKIPLAAIDGRLWSKDWDFSTNDITLPYAGFWATQYIYSEDSIVTSIYYNEMRGHHFDVTSTRNGCYPPPVPWDSSCKSTTGNHHYAQYKIFINNPDTLQFPTGIMGVILPNSVTTIRGCDGSFTFIFSVNKPGSVSVEIEVNPAPGHQPEDVTLVDSVNAGANTIVWNGLNGLGVPLMIGDSVFVTITYMNGLTNLALFDVERHLNGFIISVVRPPGPPIAIYWNDTLLASKGGTTNLTGCYSNLPTDGCHRWDGNYGGVGIGSLNTVNTWWYAASTSQIGMFAVAGTPLTPQGIIGPDTLCMGSIATYTVVPDPLPGTDPHSYEWVLTDATTGIILLDSVNTEPSISIDFALYPPGNKRLKVRGKNTQCGAGSFGPGTGLLIGANMSPQITNSINTFSVCSGDMTNILFQCSNPSATYTYTAFATAGSVSGYSGGTVNPLQQTLTNTGPGVDSAIYRVVPYVLPCPGDTFNFYVIVNPRIPVSVSVSASANPVCSGTSVTFIAVAVNGGDSPVYQWKVNGMSVGTNNPNYTYIPVNGDLVTCDLTSSLSCTSNNPATSNTLSMTINNNLLVGISISASANPVCAGTTVTFTAVPANGGNSPQYQWNVNGINTGPNSPNYIYTPVNGDLVKCTLTSNFSCTSNNPATSNTLSITVNSNPVVTFTRCFDSITITNANPIKLKGGIPLGGTYSGPGVTAGIFYPAIAGVGTKTITYTYVNSALCSAQSTATIITRTASPVTCGNAITDPRDNRLYPTVKIGSQCWMASNLNYGTMIQSNNHQRDNCIPEKYCYNDLAANCQLGTANYQWDELMQYNDTPANQGFCPPGWHIPTENDWNTLFTNYINNAFAGSPLKYSGYSGFNALLSGARFMNKTWSFDGFATYFWSSTSHGSLKAWAHAMNDYDPSVSLYPAFRSNAFSVRCLKDN